MEEVAERLTLVTTFVGREIVRSVSAYADVQHRVPGISYQWPLAEVESLDGQVVFVAIKPFVEANAEELVALQIGA